MRNTAESQVPKDQIPGEEAWMHGIVGLYADFQQAFSELSLKKKELELSHPDPEDATVLDEFYQSLTKLQLGLHADEKNKPTIIELEGLDGSGKSTMAALLESYLVKNGFNAIRLSTPPDSIKPVRRIFDQVSGTTARAYYMCSNYFLVRSFISYVCLFLSKHSQLCTFFPVGILKNKVFSSPTDINFIMHTPSH